MGKAKLVYRCQSCAAHASKWAGQCGQCGEWNTLVAETMTSNISPISERLAGYAGAANAQVLSLKDVELAQCAYVPTGSPEFDRVLGGGLVLGSVVLLGGDPGIGKSTLLLQVLSALSTEHNVLYVTGEESLEQVSLHASRLQLKADDVRLLTETQVEKIMMRAEEEKPQVMVIDSIQTLYTQVLQSAPGGVGQVRESAAQLVQFAKRTGTALFLVGHVTKEGALAGPRVLEHMVDAVLYFEGERDGRFRLLRAMKNRFGAVNELGIFAMTEKGLKDVSNPSAIFLSNLPKDVSGSVILVTWEGSRPLLVEVQALVDQTHSSHPRRVTLGLDQNRLAMLLALLHRHGGVVTYDQDVFVNVVGGVKISETASDLAVILAVLSSLKNRTLPINCLVFGEVGLAGEIRPVQSGQERLKEAAKHGFAQAIVPSSNAPKKPIEGMTVHAVDRLSQVLDWLDNTD